MTLLLAAALAVSAAAPQPHTPSRTSLIAFADAFDRAQIAKDSAALDRMVSHDLIFIDGSGLRKGKADFMAGWTSPGDRFDPITLVDRTVTMLGKDAGIVGAEVTLKGVSGGKAFSSRFRFADTFRKSDGRWRAVHIQVTRIP